MFRMCLLYSRFVENHSIWILEDGSVISEVVLSQKTTGTRYAEHVFLHPMRSVGHIVRSVASGVQNFDALFFMLVWVCCGPHKKHVGTHYAEPIFCIQWDLLVT
jgi:hypothetical protein